MKRLLLAGLVMIVSVGVAQADQLSDIKERGTLVCGMLETSRPFSFQDLRTLATVGYDADFCRMIAAELGVDAEYKLISAAARIPELQERRVDIVLANLSYSPERAEQIAFSDMYYTSPQKLLVHENAGVNSLEDLKGKRIGVIKGSRSEQDIKRILPKSQVIGYADGPAAYQALQQQEVAAQFGAELALVRLMLHSPPTAPVRILEETVLEEPWGLGIHKDEPALLHAINETLQRAEASGKAAEIHERWLGPDTPYEFERGFTITPLGQ